MKCMMHGWDWSLLILCELLTSAAGNSHSITYDNMIQLGLIGQMWQHTLTPWPCKWGRSLRRSVRGPKQTCSVQWCELTNCGTEEKEKREKRQRGWRRKRGDDMENGNRFNSKTCCSYCVEHVLVCQVWPQSSVSPTLLSFPTVQVHTQKYRRSCFQGKENILQIIQRYKLLVPAIKIWIYEPFLSY